LRRIFDAITKRQCARSTYDGSIVAPEVIDRVTRAASSDGVDALIVAGNAQREQVLELILAGNRSQLESSAFRSELKAWLRFNPAAAARVRDGLWSASSGNPNLPDWLGPLMYELTASPDGDNDHVATQVRSSSGLILFSADRDDPWGWIAAGRAYERFGLAATLEGLQHAFVNQAVEVATTRVALQSILGLGTRRVDLIIRFGRGPEMPRSLRRPVNEVLIS
jgi:hypothetical protein